MKTKTWIGWAVVLIVLILLYAIGVSSLRAQMEAALSSACNRPVRVQSASLILPAGIRLNGVTVPAVGRERVMPLSAEELLVRVSFGELAQGGARAFELELRGPKLHAVWTPAARATFSLVGLQAVSGGIALPLDRLKVNGGEVTFVDETVVPAASWNLRKVEGEFLPTQGPGQYRFRVSGLLAGSAGEESGRFAAEGTWISGGPLDAAVSIQHSDLKFLAPYLRKVLGTPPSRGRAEMASRLTVHEGVLMARNQVTAEAVEFPAGAVTTLDLEGNRLVELLRDEEGNLHLDFIVTGKLGGKLDWSDLAAGAFRESMRQAVSRGIQNVLKETEQTRPAEEVLQEQYESVPR